MFFVMISSRDGCQNPESGVEPLVRVAIHHGAMLENPRLAIICTAVVKRFVTSSRNSWFSGPIGWMLTDVEVCEPIYCAGAQRLWTLPPGRSRVGCASRGLGPGP